MYTELAVFTLAETLRQNAHTRADDHRAIKAARRRRQARRADAPPRQRRRLPALRLRQVGEVA